MGLFSTECGRCGSKEHATDNCPHEFLSTKCERCGSVDHATGDCPRGIFTTECGRCGSKEHATDNCPHEFFSTKCERCGSVDHATGDCPAGIFSTECGRCGSKNHSEEQCPHRLFAPERRYPTNPSGAGQSSGMGCGALIAIYMGLGILLIAIVWFVLALAIPLLVIDIAAIALIASLIRKQLSKFLLPLSIAGAFLTVADYNLGWFTKALATNVPFLAAMIPVLLYVNVLAGLIAAYLLIRTFMNKRNPPLENAGEFTKRNLIAMGCLLLVGVLTVGLQVAVDSHRRQALKSTATASSTGQYEATQPTWTDPSTHLMWALQDNGSNLNWESANRYCSSLTLGGYTGWRLPGIRELAGIYDPAINLAGTYNGKRISWHIKGGIRLSGGPWSATKTSGSMGPVAQLFDFYSGQRGNMYVVYSGGGDFADPRALCVRRSTATVALPAADSQGAAASAQGRTEQLQRPRLATAFDPPSNVRSAPSTASSIVCSISAPKTIRILGTEGVWYKTDACDGRLGYINRKQIRF